MLWKLCLHSPWRHEDELCETHRNKVELTLDPVPLDILLRAAWSKQAEATVSIALPPLLPSRLWAWLSVAHFLSSSLDSFAAQTVTPYARQCDEKVSQLMFSWARYTKLHQITRNAFTVQKNLGLSSREWGEWVAVLFHSLSFLYGPHFESFVWQTSQRATLEFDMEVTHVLSFSHFILALPSK